jgi:hypothetical protein
MMQRDVQVTIAAMLAGGLLAFSPATAAAQPTEPARPAATAAPPAAAPAATGTAQPATATPPAAPAATPATDKPAVPGTPAATGTPLPPGTSIKVERTAKGAKLFRITEGLLVEGQMQRPNAFLVLQRATVDYDYEALSESFLPRILAATREKPF